LKHLIVFQVLVVTVLSNRPVGEGHGHKERQVIGRLG
jgi:hypothetical protein